MVAALLLAALLNNANSADSEWAAVVQPYAADEARLPTATELQLASANETQAVVAVALLQLALEVGSNFSGTLDSALAAAVEQGADLAVTPASWLPAPSSRGAVHDILSPLVVRHNIAVAIAFESANQSCLILMDRTGQVLAEHSKPLDSATAPAVSDDGFPPTAMLATKHGSNVSVGLLLGHELLYPEVPR